MTPKQEAHVAKGDGIFLGIESSCDETGVGVVAGGTRLLGQALASSAALQKAYGGIVPEVAAREHVSALPALVDLALRQAGVGPSDLTAIAVTIGPGLVGSLLVGMTAAKSLALAWDRPLIGVHHLEAHLYANALVEPIHFPNLALLVSGGHTGLWLWRGHGDWLSLAETRDDAAGEALDKGARLLGLPYPGGPALEELARGATNATVELPVAEPADGGLDFSFSGLKTALAQGLARGGPSPAEWARALQDAVVAQIVSRVERAWRRWPVRHLYVAGGVAANGALRTRLANWAERSQVTLHVPPPAYCTDNGAMVAAAAAWLYRPNSPAPWSIGPRVPFPLGRPVDAEA
jgi:N6-L-threonylcarbamoyladenine synthase